MPKAPPKKKPTQPVAPTPPPPPPPPAAPAAPPVQDWPVVYPKLMIEEYSTTSPKGPLDPEWCAQALGWETEAQYKERKVKEFPNTKPEAWKFDDVYHCKNVAGEKVRCNYNANNRPFDMGWCEELMHTVLHGQWAGPHTVPGETVNGETVRISRYRRVLSGQHQMTACVLADEVLQKLRKDVGREAADQKYPTWAQHDHVFLETIVIKGMSEDPRVLMTVDYNKPRTSADVFYTSEVFRGSTPPERKELCRMLATAVDLLWTRTAARGYKTHPEIVAFLERHKRLLKSTEHLFHENRGAANRRINRLRLNAGHCAALCYLMAASGTTEEASEEYRNMSPPNESAVNLDLWDAAEEFWTLLADGRDFLPVRTALHQLVDSTPGSEENQGMGGRAPEKLAILARAWEQFRDHPAGAGAPFESADLEPGGDLCLSYSDLDDKGNKLPDGEIKLVDVADFYGIDCPEVRSSAKVRTSQPPDPPAPTKEEIEKATEEALARRARAAK